MSKCIDYEPCPKCQELGKDTRGDNLGVFDNGHKHCFACGYHFYPKYYLPTPVTHGNEDKKLLPDDFSRDIPSAAWKWLLQYGLPYTYWLESCGYSEKEQRLVFKVGHPLCFSIGRLIPSSEEHVAALALSNSTKRRKWYVWGDSHKHCEVIGAGKGRAIVLVEDLISAHKVGQVNEAIPLFGTVIHPCHIYYLQQANKPVIVWLDKDQQGNNHKLAIRLQGLINQPVSVVVTDKDPKELAYDVIKEEIYATKLN